MHGCEDAAATEFEGFFVCEIIFVLGIEDTIGKGLTGAHAEEVSGKTSAITVDVVESRSFLLGDTGTHGSLGHMVSSLHITNLLGRATYHAETHALIRVDKIGEDFGCGCYRNAALVSELV